VYLGGAAALVLAFLVGLVVGKYLFESTEASIPSELFGQHSLLTWKGIPQLKQELAALPKDSVVYWNDWPRKFTYPQDGVVRELVEFARSKGVRLEQSPHLE